MAKNVKFHTNYNNHSGKQ